MKNSIAEAMITGESSGTLTVIFHACDEEKGFVAECIELPGCFSEGETIEEAESNIKEAINACLSVLFEDCLERLRARVDFGRVDMRCVSKQERLTVQIPQLQVPEYA
jgi:predicted RNase H-like HicB family nuclease